MKKTIFILLCLYLINYADWRQTNFVIGSCIGPNFLGAGHERDDSIQVAKYKNLNFNLIEFPNEFGLRNQVFSDPSAPNYNSSGVNASASYRLSILKKVGGISMFTIDADNWPTFYNNCLCAESLSKYEDRVKKMVERYNAIPNNSLLIGYSLGDEPGPGTTVKKCPSFAGPPNAIDANIKMLETQTKYDPDRLSYFNLRAYAGFKSWDNKGDDSSYTKYVKSYITNVNTKVVSFDYYTFEDNTTTNGYFPMNSPDQHCHYFRHLNLYANEIKAQVDSGRYKLLWGVPCATQHNISDGRHYIYPEMKHLRYNVYSNILYGAKGIIWYDYTLHATGGGETYIKSIETGDDNIQSNVAKINKELTNLGPTLMNLNWIKTIHGTGTDPSSGELKLNTFTDNNTTPFYGTAAQAFQPGTGASGWKKDSLAIGIFKGGKWHLSGNIIKPLIPLALNKLLVLVMPN